MGAARKVWQDAKGKIKVAGWETKLKMHDDFGPKLDELEKFDQALESKVKSLHADIAQLAQKLKYLNQSAIIKAISSSDAVTVLTREERQRLDLAERKARKEAGAAMTLHLENPVREFLGVLEHELNS